MPLAALFIGGVLPAQLCSLIRKRAGYMKKIQPQVEKFNLELNKKKASSCKLQAWQWLKDIIGLTEKGINMDTAQLKRIADAIEEILRLVKKDMEPREKNKK